MVLFILLETRVRIPPSPPENVGPQLGSHIFIIIKNKKQKMKKALAILTIATLTACGGATTEVTTDSTVVTTDTTAVVADTTAPVVEEVK
jgi:hypothetical protein